METKFTPGPWAVNEGNAWVCTVGNNTSDPAVFCNKEIEPGTPYPFGDKWADAHLIAAAPEMYAAAAPIAELGEGFAGSDETYISVTAGELRALAAALRKARGNP